MRHPLSSTGGRARSRSGAALLLSLLILLVLFAIVFQINVGTGTNARVARNDVGLTTMDLAVDSALLQVDDQLKTDAESAGAQTPSGGMAPGGGGGAAAAPSGGAVGAAAGQGQAASDSRKDEWARPQRTSINDIRVRILVQDEDSKINVLNLLDPDEKEAEAAFDRVVRCLDLCREGTQADIDTRTAERMARAMLDYMKDRKTSRVPRPALLSDNPQNEDLGLPLSLKEFAVLPPFDESHFRDFRDQDGKIVHSIGSFLTVWSSVATVADLARSGRGGASGGAPGTPGAAGAAGGASGAGSGAQGQPATGKSSGSSAAAGTGGSAGAPGAAGAAPGAAGAGGAGASAGGVDTGGYAVNVNTAPVAVLKALFDSRDLHPRFWDRVLEYRNLEEEKPKDAPESEKTEAPLDEYGEPIVDRRIFDTPGELSEVEGYQDLPSAIQAKLSQLITTESHVFSIFVIARRSTAAEGDMSEELGTPEEIRAREEAGNSLLRVVRSVVWRHKGDDQVEIVPLVRWEVLDYLPYEVQDYPDEKR